MSTLLSRLLLFVFCLQAVAQDANQPQQTEADLRHKIHSQQIHNAITGQIPNQLARTSGDLYLATTDGPYHGMQFDPLGTLWNLGCENDLVVLGKIGKGTSHPTIDQSYIYTDWDLEVSQTLKNNARSPVQVGQIVVVTRPGGRLEINGRHVFALNSDLPQFHPGDEVLLYLRHLPVTGTYSLIFPEGFLLSGSLATPLGKEPVGHFGEMAKDGLLDLARKALSEKCNTGGK